MPRCVARRLRVALLCLLAVGSAVVPAASGVVARAAPAVASSRDPLLGPHARDAQEHPTASLTPRARLAPASKARPRAATSNGLSQEIFGFAPYWDLSAWPEWRQQDLSTIAYFGVALDGAGNVVNDSGWTGWNSADLSNLVVAAHGAGNRVLVTLRVFDEATINSIVTVPQYTQAAISQAIALMQQRGLDGITVDFEGYASSQYPQLPQGMTNFLTQLTQQAHAATPGSEIVVATYASSADNDAGIFNIDAIAPNVDAIYIMAYDMFLSGIASADAPLHGPLYNDTDVVYRFLQRAPAAKLILGVPYYGYKWSTTSPGLNAATNGGFAADTYSSAFADFACAQSLSLNWDTTTVTPWASWYSPPSGDPCGGNHGSWRELYWDDANSLGAKYDLVRAAGLRGTGPWALGYDTGRSELWDLIAQKFTGSVPAVSMAALAPSQNSRDFGIAWGPNPGSAAVSRYTIWANDNGSGWQVWTSVASTSTGATFTGAPGHTYWFYAQASNSAGSSPPPSPAGQAQTTVSTTAPVIHPFGALYFMDAFGGVHGSSSPPAVGFSVWPGWPIARSLALRPGGTGGYTLDGWGGVHPFGDAPAVSGYSYWQGWDIARILALAPDGHSGYTLDAWGGVHPFGGAPAVTTTAYWQGWDIARGMVLRPDGHSGWVLDGWGGIHGFGTPGDIPANPTIDSFWYGWDIARGITLESSGAGGYVIDGWGGLHAFGDAPPRSGAFWYGWDIVRGMVLLPGGGDAGYTLDGLGGVHAFGGAPAVTQPGYLGYDAARWLVVG